MTNPFPPILPVRSDSEARRYEGWLEVARDARDKIRAVVGPIPTQHDADVEGYERALADWAAKMGAPGATLPP
jgi:hypothetical protein